MTDELITLTECWKSFNIKKCIEIIKKAWSQVISSDLRSVWQMFAIILQMILKNLKMKKPQSHN